MIKAIVFDFDGVIVDSNRLKEEAFFRVFEGSREVSRELVADVLRRNFGTRFDILRDILTRSGAGEDRIVQLMDEGARRFDALVQGEIAERGLVDGARELLASLGEKFCLYINSATPETALQATIARLGIGHHFRGIHGMPPALTKEENLRAILSREGIDAKETVVIGDGIGDLTSARALGTHFIAIASGFYDWTQESADFPRATRLKEAVAMIDTLIA